MPKAETVANVVRWLTANNIPLPLDLRLQLEGRGYLKSRAAKQGDIAANNTEYHDAITETLIGYFESGGPVTSYKSEFKRATVEAFGTAFDSGWVNGGQELPADDEALEWLNARVDAEFGFIDMLFQEAKELRKEDDFDYFSWITQRADGYVRTLAEIYNQARLRASEDIMVTFDGDDGEESCDDCQKYKGKRHKISWFVKRNAVPPFGTGLECHRGGRCRHGLFDDDGNQITV